MKVIHVYLNQEIRTAVLYDIIRELRNRFGDGVFSFAEIGGDQMCMTLIPDAQNRRWDHQDTLKFDRWQQETVIRSWGKNGW